MRMQQFFVVLSACAALGCHELTFVAPEPGADSIAEREVELTQQAALNKGRVYTGGLYRLELDGVQAGWVTNVEGGLPKAEVVVEKVGPGNVARKHIAGLSYEEMRFKVGSAMSQGFYDWLSSTLKADDGGPVKNGRVTGTATAGVSTRNLHFQHASVTSIELPALDVARREPVELTVSLRPEVSRFELSPAEKATPRVPARKKQQWSTNLFKLSLDGLAETCAHVTRVESLALRRKPVPPIGEQRDYEGTSSVEIPNLVITFPESHAKPILDWFEDFVVQGNAGQDREKSGSLELLSPNGEALLRVRLEQCGIFRVDLTPGDDDANLRASLYCEGMKFDVL